jgi:hypothetical protein
VYHYRPRHLERGDKITPPAETGNFWARLEHERFLSTQTTVSGSSTDPAFSGAGADYHRNGYPANTAP